MVDRLTKDQRSRNMARIRNFGNKSTELRMAKLLRQYGLRGWRRHPRLPGRPDFVFPRERVALFIDGCFWHCCPRCNWMPNSNAAYWTAKFAANRSRDRKANRALRRGGWRVIRVWEHSLERPVTVMARLFRVLASKSKTVKMPRFGCCARGDDS
jgi:DNA mismatch endonuclease (patch repair protein)